MLILPEHRRLYFPAGTFGLRQAYFAKLHTPGCGSGGNCCGESCTLLSDNFTRADSSSLGSLWTEALGDWEIISNTLRVTTSGANAVLVSAAAPTQQSYKITTQVNNLSTNDKIRLIFGYVDSSNYYFAELLFSTSGYIRIYQKSGGTDTLLTDTIAINTSLGISTATISLCYDGSSVLTATHENTLAQASVGVDPPASTAKCGIAVANSMTTSDAQFVSVTVEKVQEGCETCGPGNCCAMNPESPFDLRCLFDNNGPPLTVEVSFSGIVNDATRCPVLCELGNDSWILTHRNLATFDCYPQRGGCASYIYQGFFNYAGSACTFAPDTHWCRYEIRASIAWHSIPDWEYIIRAQYYVFNNRLADDFATCEEMPCPHPSNGEFLAGLKSAPIAVPVGGIDSSAIGTVPLVYDSDGGWCDNTTYTGSFTVLS